MDPDNLVRLDHVRVVRAVSFGVFCLVSNSESEVFVPFAQVHEPPASHLLPGAIVEMVVPSWFAREHRLL